MSAERVAGTDVGLPSQSLSGRMGVVEVALSVLAFSSPLTTAWGYLPFVVIFAGLGAPVAFLAAMFVLLLFCVGYVTMSRNIPNPGAFYSFIAHGLNRSLGLGSAFVATAAYFLLISGVSSFFGIVASGLIADKGGPAIAWYWLTLALLIIVGIFGYIGIEFSAKTLTVLMVIEILIVAAFDVAVMGSGGPGGRTLEPFTFDAISNGDLALGVMYAIVTFVGFEGTAIFREEARDPDRTIPRATYLSVAFIGLFYAFTVWCLIVAIGPDSVVGSAADDPAGLFPGAYGELVGSLMRDVAAAFVLTAVFASTLATHNIFSRYMFSLGVDGALPRALGRVHPRQRSPHVASVTGSVLCVLLFVSVVISHVDPGVYYGRVAGAASLCIILLMLATSVAVLAHFGRSRIAAVDGTTSLSAWNTRIAPAMAALGLGAVAFLAFKNANAFMAATTTISVAFVAGIVIVFLSGVVFARFLKSRKPDVYARIGRQSVAG